VTRRVLSMSAAVRRSVVQHALRDRPAECCGFLLGTGHHVRFAVAMENLDAKRTVRYRIDDRTHLQLRRLLRTFAPALSIQGVYHSHPAGDAKPSETDIAEALYPEWVYVIVGLGRRRPAVKAFQIQQGRVHPVSMR